MKVLYVVTKSEAGGAQTHVYQMARALRERGHEPAVMARPDGWLAQAAPAVGARFYPNPHLSNRMSAPRDLRAAVAVVKAVRGFGPDLLSCHSSKAGVITRLAVRGRIPTVFTAHGWGFAERGPLLSRLLFVPAEQLAARYAGRIICVSGHVRSVALRHRIAPPGKLVVIHNGAERCPAPRPGAAPRSSPVEILFVGRLVGQKDPETLLRAYAALPRAIAAQTRLRLIGEGEKRAELERFIGAHGLADRVELAGALERDAVLEALRRADIFVLTSHYEGLPRTALEAMHAGLPLIATAVPGVREVFENVRHGAAQPIGIPVGEGDAGQVAAAIERLVADPGQRAAMGRAARRRARRCFSLDRMVEETLGVYGQALSSTGS